jgi:hypothetical protein
MIFPDIQDEIVQAFDGIIPPAAGGCCQFNGFFTSIIAIRLEQSSCVQGRDTSCL